MRSGQLCLTLTPQTLDEVFSADISRADCVEVRLDYLKEPQQSVQARWDRLALPVIATCRGKERGGQFEGSIEEEINILQSAARNGARYVDIDYRFARPFGEAQVIASYHNFESTPDNIGDILDQACSSDAQIGKVATQVNSWSDNCRIFELLSRKRSKPVIAMGMGDMGQITRVAGPSRGGFLTYAASTLQAAPGQMNIDEMLDVYKFRRIKASTKLIGIVGMPVAHSKSPNIHNRAFAAANLDYAYLKFPVRDIDDFINSARILGIHGFSVTIPHKMAVMPYLASMSETVREVGAVNTVLNVDGSWIGNNTDVHGVRAAIASVGFNPAGKRVVILGRGGGAKAAAAALKDAREVVMLSRQEVPNVAQYPCDLLINATPIGMSPKDDASPVSGSIQAEAVFDMVYNPHNTKLLRTAAEQGITIIHGIKMLVSQAAKQFEIWTGHPAPAEVFEAEFNRS